MKAEWLRMKAEELMIGDWVLVRMNHTTDKYKEGDYIPHKVVVIRDWRKDTNEIELNIIQNNSDQDDFVKPIPITAEILEENAFERVQDIFVLMWKNGVYPSMIFIEYIPTNYCLFINDMLLPKPVRYVHELQHILSICGLDKGITI